MQPGIAPLTSKAAQLHAVEQQHNQQLLSKIPFVMLKSNPPPKITHLSYSDILNSDPSFNYDDILYL